MFKLFILQIRNLALSLLVTLPMVSQAYYSTMDTGELQTGNDFKLNLETQFVSSGDEGINFNGRIDTALTDDTNLRGLIGFGTTDFQVGGYLKWIPIPDIDNQPAMGLLGGLNYARFEDENDVSLRIVPLASKKLSFEFGQLTPYAALPFGLRSYADETDVPLQLELGSEIKINNLHEDLKNLSFMFEVGFDLVDAFSYISLGVNFQGDLEKGITW